MAAAIRDDGRELADLVDGDVRELLGYLLSPKGLSYGALPKALLKFHGYEDGSRTAFEEHLVEAAEYARDAGDVSRLNFTVSPEHEIMFDRLLADILPKYERAYGVRYEVAFSKQKPSTDALAVDMENRPFLDTDGRLFFRPSGHGALIANLEEIEADVVFVKNIDNVVPDHAKQPTYHWKKVIGGLLVEVQSRIFGHVRTLRRSESTAADVDEALAFFCAEFGVRLPDWVASAGEEDRREFALAKLDRPLRVCGMVRNTGEPGGGPFWVNNGGEVSAQVVESAQVDPESVAQQRTLAGATHFNPVDLVCATRDCDGSSYDLARYVDESAVFIAEKSKDGRPLKSLERPGLWNGGMADWNTLFVDVPLETFAPVKTVTALIAGAHQKFS